MFDISWTEFLLLAVVTLIVVGPKDLPPLMRSMGRYAGIVRRQAAEFRQQFDAAMREAELADIRKEVDRMHEQAKASLDGVNRPISFPYGAASAPADATPASEKSRDPEPPVDAEKAGAETPTPSVASADERASLEQAASSLETAAPAEGRPPTRTR